MKLSSSNDEALYEVFYDGLKLKNKDYIAETVSQFNTQQFIEHFRVSQEVANSLTQQFEESQYFFQQSGPFGKITAHHFVLIFLWFASYRDVIDRFCTLRKVIVRMIYFLSNYNIITWPSQEEQDIIRQ